MKAAVITRFGRSGLLKIREDWPVPDPAEDEVRIRVRAVGLNFADVMARLGLYPNIPSPPFVPGIEVAGEIDALGHGVTSVSRGKRVVAFTPQGGYAEYACTKAAHVYQIPDEVPWTDAAALGVTYMTAYHGLITLAHAQPGERLLLHAAAGGVGTAALQLSHILGLRVLATAGSAAKTDLARSLGADRVVNYREEDFAQAARSWSGNQGVDVVMDSVGGRVFREGWRILAPMGRYVLFGFAAVAGRRTYNRFRALRELMAMPLLFPHTLLQRNVSLHCFNLYFIVHKSDYLRQAMDEILHWYKEGRIRPVVRSVVPFDQIANIHQQIQQRGTVGKVVAIL